MSCFAFAGYRRRPRNCREGTAQLAQDLSEYFSLGIGRASRGVVLGTRVLAVAVAVWLATGGEWCTCIAMAPAGVGAIGGEEDRMDLCYVGLVVSLDEEHGVASLCH